MAFYAKIKDTTDVAIFKRTKTVCNLMMFDHKINKNILKKIYAWEHIRMNINMNKTFFCVCVCIFFIVWLRKTHQSLHCIVKKSCKLVCNVFFYKFIIIIAWQRKILSYVTHISLYESAFKLLPFPVATFPTCFSFLFSHFISYFLFLHFHLLSMIWRRDAFFGRRKPKWHVIKWMTNNG